VYRANPGVGQPQACKCSWCSYKKVGQLTVPYARQHTLHHRRLPSAAQQPDNGSRCQYGARRAPVLATQVGPGLPYWCCCSRSLRCWVAQVASLPVKTSQEEQRAHMHTYSHTDCMRNAAQPQTHTGTALVMTPQKLQKRSQAFGHGTHAVGSARKPGRHTY
jgi:hypothetical protein